MKYLSYDLQVSLPVPNTPDVDSGRLRSTILTKGAISFLHTSTGKYDSTIRYGTYEIFHPFN